MKRKFSLLTFVVLYFLPVTICLLHIGLFIAFSFFEPLKYNYLYHNLSDFKLFVQSFCICVLIPLGLLGIFFAISMRSKNKTVVKISAWISYIFLLVWLLVTFICSASCLGGFSSNTQNLGNYGTYDSLVKSSTEFNDFSYIFPDSDVVTEQSSYYYDFNYGAIRERYWIELNVDFDNEIQYNEEVNRLQQYNLPETEEDLYSISDKIGRAHAVVQLDHETLKIRYCLICGYGDEMLSQFKTA